jgi:ribose-phosphate pyrophosphokinase
MDIVLDLTSENSEIKYKISRFPDGQQSVDIVHVLTPNTDDNVTIKSRLCSFKDLELIISATASLKEMGIKNINLYIPYFLGGRSDRKFSEGGSNYIKNVIAPIINLQNYKSVSVYDSHSDVIEACVNNYIKISNVELVMFAMKDITKDITKDIYSNDTSIISPDAGALKKAFGIAKIFDRDRVIMASKVRNLITGEISHTEVPLIDSDANKFVIIDDICDGGRTFTEIAKVILSKRPKREFNTEIYLIVSHGIFSKGFKELNKYFDGIYSTNSYSEISDDSFMENNPYEIKKIKQLDIFKNEY